MLCYGEVVQIIDETNLLVRPVGSEECYMVTANEIIVNDIKEAFFNQSPNDEEPDSFLVKYDTALMTVAD